MPFALHDPLYGHVVIFFAHSASAKFAKDVTWGPSSIDVPHNSPLNGLAEVWFRLSSVSLQRAFEWCSRSNVRYLGEWPNPTSTPPSGFGFCVPHFSRYRYVDSDDDDPDNDNDHDDENDEGTPHKDRDSTKSRSSTERKAVGPPPVDDQASAGHARLLRAGSTPARPRASRSRSTSRGPPSTSLTTSQCPPFFRPPVPPPTPATISRPCMSTREILDLDDTDVDADIDDGDLDISSEKPVVAPKAEPAPESTRPEPRESFGMGAFPGHPPVDTLHASNESDLKLVATGHHRDLFFTDPNDLPSGEQNAISERIQGLGLVSYWKSEPRLEAPNLHQWRDAMFSPYKTQGMKRESNVHDVDMTDVAPHAMDSPDEMKLVEPWYLGANEDRNVEELASREADDFVGDEDDRPPTLLSDSLMDSAMPFPELRFSVISNRCNNFVDINLAQGRSFRATFSQAGELLASTYNLTTGFILNVTNVDYVASPTSRFAYSSFLSRHCALWYNHHSSDHGFDLTNTPASSPDSKQRIVRVPSWDSLFRDINQVDYSLKTITECLECMESKLREANASHARIIFDGLFALYCSDLGTGRPGTDMYNSKLLELITDWVRHSAGVALDEDVEQFKGLKKSVMSMTLGDVEAAVDNAVELGQFRLAMLIARSLDGLKNELRADAEAQLSAYNFKNNIASASLGDDSTSEAGGDEDWDHILTSQDENTHVTVEERMILLLLAGRVGPVARYLNVSWYRVFVMELLYGAGSSDLSQPQRVAAAINAVPKSGISTLAPHRETNDEDTAYKVLQLYATRDAGDKPPIGLFCNSGIGLCHRPLDYRFTWTLHQVLRGLIPESSPKYGGLHMAAGLADQLEANDMPLWAFYVLCCGGSSDNALRERLIRSWPQICEDFAEVSVNTDGTLVANADPEQNLAQVSEEGHSEMESESSKEAGRMEPEAFLKNVLGVPEAWLCEAKAVAARECGYQLEECGHWIGCGDERGAIEAQNLLLKDIVPNAIVVHDTNLLKQINELLEQLEAMNCVPNWASNGGLILGYLRYVLGVPTLYRTDLNILKELAGKVVRYFKRISSDLEQCAARKIADGIVTAQRALLVLVDITQREDWFMSNLADLEELPCTRAVRLRVTGEYMVANTEGWPSAQRMASAFPAYRKYLELGMESRIVESRMENEIGGQIDAVMAT